MTVPETVAARDDQATLWSCDGCLASGVILLAPHVDVYSVLGAIVEAHSKAAPDCHDGLALIRVTYPNQWLRSQLTAMIESGRTNLAAIIESGPGEAGQSSV